MTFGSIRELFVGDVHYRDMDKSEKAAYLLPIRLSVIYLVASVIIYIICPFEWVTYRPFLFYGLLFFYFTAFWGGYRIGVLNPLKSSYEWTEKHTDRFAKTLSVLVVFNFFLYIVNIFRDYGFATFDFAGLVKQMAVGLRDPGYGYNLRYERLKVLNGADVVGGYGLTLLNYFWAFFRYPILIASMLYFKRLRLYAKVFVVLNLAVTLIFFLSIGTTIDVFTVFLLLELPIVLKTFIRWREKRIKKKHVLQLIGTMLAGLLIVMCYFTWMMVSRGGINSYDDPSYNVGGIKINIMQEESADPEEEQNSPEEESWFHVPPIIMKFWVSFTAYLTQGYYAFSMALTQDWTPMFGLGSNMWTVDFITDHIYDIDQFTYQAKLEPFGWDSRVRWHSMFTWLANDLSLYGVIIYMLVIGCLFGVMFKDAITTRNPFAQTSIFYFILMIFFMPCNNQLGQRAETLFSFVFIIACWIISKHPFPAARRVFDKLA